MKQFLTELRGLALLGLDLLVKYPKAIATVAAYVVLAAAYFGLHLTTAEVITVAGVLVPAVLAHYHFAVKAQVSQAQSAAAAAAKPPSV